MPCKFPAGHPDENNNFGNAEVCSRYGGVWLDLPDSPASNERLDLLSNFTGTGLLSKAIPRIGAKGVPNITGQPRTIQQVQKAPQSVVKPEPLIASRPPPTTGLFNKTAEKAGQFARQHPVVTAATVASPALSLMGEGPVTDKKVVQNNTPVNQASPMLTKEQIKAKNIALMNAKNAGDKDTVDAILKTGTAPAEGTSNTRRVPTQGLLTTDANSSGVYNGSPFITPEAPANKGEVEGGLSNLWSNMQKPGYWSDKVEGGSGSWDNRLFRLGEMMSYMGTPLSKRGKNPADRWTTAAASANKTAEATKKAQDAAAAKKLKDANYNWKLKEITDIAGDKFDSWFGTDIPMFGKSKDEQRSRFLSDLTDAKAAYGASKSLQQIIEDLLEKGDYK
jgi:hypothetical protein